MEEFRIGSRFWTEYVEGRYFGIDWFVLEVSKFSKLLMRKLCMIHSL